MECPDLDFYFEELPSKLSTDSKTTFEIFKTKKSNKKLPIKIQKPKIGLKSQNVWKQTIPKYSHRLQNNFQIFKNSKIKLKKMTP